MLVNKDITRIPIFFTFDNGYVPQAGVAFESLLTNSKKNVFYELLVVHSCITENNQVQLNKLVAKHANAELSFIMVKDENLNVKFDDDSFCLSHAGTVFTKDTLYRCIPDIIPDFNKYEKIIYSDVDIIVVDDISELWDTELGDKYLAGVKAPRFLWEERTHLPDKFEDKYFAGGIWVMNLAKMREDNIGNRALSIIANPPFRLRWNDQDVMNLACDTNVTYISYRYISIPSWQPMLEKKNYEDEYYPNKELKDCMFRPKIVHYAGGKPWKELRTLKSSLWFYWLEKTSFYNDVCSKIIAELNDKPVSTKWQNIKGYIKILFYCSKLIIGEIPIIGNKLFSKGRKEKLCDKICGICKKNESSKFIY